MVTTHLNNIARALGTSPDEASRLLRGFVQRIWADVATRGSANIPGLGTIRRSGANFVFDAEDALAAAVNAEYLGLDSYDLPAPGKPDDSPEKESEEKEPFSPSDAVYETVGPRFAPIDTTLEPLDQALQPFPFAQESEDNESGNDRNDAMGQAFRTFEKPDEPVEPWQPTGEPMEVPTWNPGPEEEPDSIWNGERGEHQEDLNEPDLTPFPFGGADTPDEDAVRNPWALPEEDKVEDVWKWETEDNPSESVDEDHKPAWNFTQPDETAELPEWPPFEAPETSSSADITGASTAEWTGKATPEWGETNIPETRDETAASESWSERETPEPWAESASTDLWQEADFNENWNDAILPEGQSEATPADEYTEFREEGEEEVAEADVEEIEQETVLETPLDHAAFAAAVPPVARRRSPMLWLVPVVFFVLAGALFVYLRSIEGNRRVQLPEPGSRPSAAITDSSLTAGADSAAMGMTTPDTTTIGQPDATRTEPAQGQAATAADPVRGGEPIDVTAGGVTWVVGSSQNREDAEALAAQVRRQGWRSSVLYGDYKGKTNYRVAVGQFRDGNEARQARPTVVGIAKDAWPMPIQKNFKVF